MIIVVREGVYRLLGIKNRDKFLILDEERFYRWVVGEDLLELLIKDHKTIPDNCLSEGSYRLYRVKSEPRFADNLHLELLGKNTAWRGFLLPDGLPTKNKTKSSIIPTAELITRPKI